MYIGDTADVRNDMYVQNTQGEDRQRRVTMAKDSGMRGSGTERQTRERWQRMSANQTGIQISRYKDRPQDHFSPCPRLESSLNRNTSPPSSVLHVWAAAGAVFPENPSASSTSTWQPLSWRDNLINRRPLGRSTPKFETLYRGIFPRGIKVAVPQLILAPCKKSLLASHPNHLSFFLLCPPRPTRWSTLTCNCIYFYHWFSLFISFFCSSWSTADSGIASHFPHAERSGAR